MKVFTRSNQGLVKGRYIVLMLCFLPVIVGCRQFAEDVGLVSPEEVQPQQSTTFDDLMLATMEDGACDLSGTTVAVSSVDVWIWDGTITNRQTVPLLADRSGSEEYFASASVEGSLYGYADEQICTYNGSLDCKSTGKEQALRVIKICKSPASYGRQSLEGITITSQYLVERANSFYESLTTKKANIKSSALIIHPQIIKHVTLSSGAVKTLVDSHNAAFATSPETAYGYFLVFPSSKKSYAKSPVNLWEVPFVMSHEFGHNVFAHHVEKAAESVGLSIRSHEDLDLHHILPRSFEEFENQQGRSKSREKSLYFATDAEIASKSLKGVNELFADLYGFYGNGSATGLLKGITCLDKTRDPLADATPAGFSKVWGPTQLNIFEGRVEASDTAGCSEPAFDGEHDVAAVLGYPIVTLYKALAPSVTDVSRMSVIVSWLDSVASHVTQNGNDITLDSMMALMIEKIVAESTVSAALKSTACQSFKSRVTGLATTSAACL
jgi:hypothetical protein